MKRLCLGFLTGLVFLMASAQAGANGVFGLGPGLSGGYRWDAAARFDSAGRERSLVGGLRYSMQGGSYQAFRDLFTWNVLPSVALFQQTVEEAFAAWTAVDPATGLGTALSFVADFETEVAGTLGLGINPAGAEIDLLAATSAGSWNVGSAGLQGEATATGVFGTVTLTSGTTNYASGVLLGADIKLNSNPEAVYTIDIFRLLLSHELGHALGFQDADTQAGPTGNFIDDNYDGTSAETALATLTNSWALKVNPLNPAASVGLARYTVANGDPGTKTPGVNILMESQGLGGQFGNLSPLSNDDYGTRQFLYPVLAQAAPEPGTLALGALGLWALRTRRRRG